MFERGRSTLYDRLPHAALLLEDRGFFSSDDWKTLYLRAKMLVRAIRYALDDPRRTGRNRVNPHVIKRRMSR